MVGPPPDRALASPMVVSEATIARRLHPSAMSTLSNFEQLLAAKEIVIACGSGGVGKTTTAAAAGMMAAITHGGKVLVLTVDPARRLADALGLDGFGNEPQRVPQAAFEALGVEPRGELWAAMLDTKESWDALVRQHAPDVRTAQKILDNKLYANVTGRFVQSHEYIAMERLYELHTAGTFDLIVVDTPPTRNAVDFLEAPARMADFFSSKLLTLLSAPARSRMMNLATRPFYSIADKILGSQFLSDIAEFFQLFQTMAPGFVERAHAVDRVLHDKRTTFFVVTTLEVAPAREGEFFIQALQKSGFHLGALVLNKVLPGYLLDEEAAHLADRLKTNAAEIVSQLPADIGDPRQVERVLREVAESFRNYRLIAQREAEMRSELGIVPDVVVSVPYFDTDISDLMGLIQLGQVLWS